MRIMTKMQSLQEAYEDLVRQGLTHEHVEQYAKENTAALYKSRLDNTKRFKMVTAEMGTLYAKKNRDYGNSFDVSLDEDGLLVSKIRLGDKYKRFSQLINNESEVKDESIRDTLVDMANYAAMTIMWMDAKADLEHTKHLVVSGV